MNPRELSDSAFDHIADDKLRLLERAMEDFDPDEVEPSMGGDVLALSLGNGGKIIINRHRAARQIWMAAARQAWHFDPTTDASGSTSWQTDKAGEELVATLEKVLSEQLRRPVKLDKAR